MPRVSVSFFAVGVVYLLIGMLWGIHMGETGDHSLYPAHAHLNLMGWVSMGLFGTFYALARDQVSMRLAWINFILSNLSVLLMIPFLARLLATNDIPPNLPFIIAGEIAAVLGVLVFGFSVFRLLLKRA